MTRELRIDSATDGRESTAVSDTSTEAPPLVLLVEDDPDVRNIMAELVEGLGYQVATAENGQQTLHYLHSVATLPRLILLDLMMPVMNGWQFVVEVQKNAALAAIPIVVVSAFDEESNDLLNLNVAGRLRKPVTYAQLVAVIEQYC